MKKIHLLFVLLLASVMTFSQTVLFEGFDSGQMPPSGWFLTGDGQNQWSTVQTAMAGGSPPEARFNGYNEVDGKGYLISYMMDMTGVSSITLFFKHYYDNNMLLGPKVGVATRAQWSPWHTIWEINPTTSVGPEEVVVIIDNEDMGKTQFQICFYIDGNFNGFNYWTLDNIQLMNPLDLDCQMSMVNVPTLITEPVQVAGQVRNVGITPVTDLQISWMEYNGIVHTDTITGLSLDTYDTYDFTFDGYWNSPYGTFDLNVWIDQVNGGADNDLANDTLSKAVNKIVNYLPQRPLFEEFTSSTCVPCANFNASFVPWCQSHPDITLVKYQMSWPSPGDPYYTPEGGVRRSYYGVNAVPNLFCNGSNVSTTIGAVETAYNEAIQQTALLEFASAFTITGTTINLTTNILPYDNYGTKKVYIAVVEKVTTGNIMNNGETEFHHVMMKMIPDASGSNKNLQSLSSIHMQNSVDLSGTNVEEYDDLAVAVWIQDDATREVLQSAYALEYTTLANEARLNMITLDGEPLVGFDPDVYEYEVGLPEGTITEPFIEADPMDDDALVIIQNAFEIPGTARIEVYAQDRNTKNTYSITYSINTGVDKPARPSVQVYPNPTAGRLYLTGVKDARVTIHGVNGNLIRSYNKFSGTSLDISDLPRGVYILDILMDDANMIRKKVILF